MTAFAHSCSTSPRRGLARAVLWFLALSVCLPVARPESPGKLDAFEANLTLRNPPPDEENWVHSLDESLDGPYAGFSVRL